MSGFLLIDLPTDSLKPLKDKVWGKRGAQLTRYLF